MSSGELWYVKLPDGDVHRVTLDQLDEAFQAGRIDGDTMVLAAGATQWTKLGELAGLEDAPPPPPPVAHAAMRPPAGVAHAAARMPPLPQAPYVAPYANPNSIRPVSMDLGDMDFDAPVPKRSGKRWAVGLAAFAVVGAAAFIGTNRPDIVRSVMDRTGLRGGGETAAAAVVAPPPVAAPPPAPDPAPAPPPAAAPQPATNTATASASNTNGAPVEASPLMRRFTDQTNQKLVAADKQREQKMHGSHGKGHSGGGATAPAPKGHSSGGSFTTDGNKFDPLNSSI